MASPIGHGLFALFATRFLAGERDSRLGWFAFAMFAALAPDLDFLPGILVGVPGRFHHGASHSLFSAFAFAGVLALLAAVRSVPRVKLGIVGGMLYGSHLLVDLLTKDTGAPIGQPFLWPFSDSHFALAAPPLSNIIHGPSGTVLEFLRSVFSTHNLMAGVRELLLLGPPLAGLWLLMDWRRSIRRCAFARPDRGRNHSGSPSSIAPVD